MKVLGLDASSVRTGCCIVEDGYLDFKSLDTIDPPPKLLMGKKLLFFEKAIKKLLKKHRPDAVVIENIFRGPNIITFKTLSMFRGVAYKCVQEVLNLEPESIMPTEARKAVGCGPKKEDAFEWITKKYDFRDFTFNKHNDICDSIILALSYFQPRPHPKLKKTKRKKK